MTTIETDITIDEIILTKMVKGTSLIQEEIGLMTETITRNQEEVDSREVTLTETQMREEDGTQKDQEDQISQEAETIKINNLIDLVAITREATKVWEIKEIVEIATKDNRDLVETMLEETKDSTMI